MDTEWKGTVEEPAEPQCPASVGGIACAPPRDFLMEHFISWSQEQRANMVLFSISMHGRGLEQ